MADTKLKSIQDDMPSARFFATPAEAAAALTSDQSTYADIGDAIIVSPVDAKRGVSALGMDDEGNFVFDSEMFSPGTRVMISKLSTRVDGEKSKLKGIVVAPVPSEEQILADEAGRAWLSKIINTELQRLSVSGLRDRKDAPTDIQSAAVLDSMPKCLADFVTSSRGGSSTLMQAFEENWKIIKAGLAKLSPSWVRANITKREFIYSMSSKAYAFAEFATLEENKAGSLFEMAIRGFKAKAMEQGLDYSIFDQWAATRDEKVIEAKAEEDDQEFDFDAFAATLGVATEVAPAAA